MSRREFDNGLLLQFFELVDAAFETGNYFSMRFQGEVFGRIRSTQKQVLIKYYVVKFLLYHCEFTTQQVAEFLLTESNSINFIDKRSKIRFRVSRLANGYKLEPEYMTLMELSKEITGDTKFYPPKPATK